MYNHLAYETTFLIRRAEYEWMRQIANEALLEVTRISGIICCRENGCKFQSEYFQKGLPPQYPEYV